MAQYESEHTQFMRQWLAQHPDEAQVQRSGRALWWDRPPRGTEEQRRVEEDRVPRKPYYYG